MTGYADTAGRAFNIVVRPRRAANDAKENLETSPPKTENRSSATGLGPSEIGRPE